MLQCFEFKRISCWPTDSKANLIYQIHDRLAHALQAVVFLDSVGHSSESDLDVFAKTEFDRLLKVLLGTSEWIQLPSTVFLLDSLRVVILIAKQRTDDHRHSKVKRFC